jgi:hypothetical protein
MADEDRQGELWHEDLEGWERGESEFPEDESDGRAA